MKRLIVAEKPSVARAIARAVGADREEDGFLEGERDVVTWCRGHLVELSPPDRYPEWAGRWNPDDLPMVPEEWLWEPSEEDGAARQLGIVTSLMGRGDVAELVNACDADREGEGIFRRVLSHAGCPKPALRFWSTALTPEAVERDLAAMRPLSDYDGLADAAEGRAKADWLVGLNATRAYASLYGAQLTAGRVQTAVLSLVVERTRAARSFEAVPFWLVEADLGGFAAESGRFGSREEAEAAAEKVRAAGTAAVEAAERREERPKAPPPYDLTALQRDAAKRCGLTADETLKALQSLYERGLVTYPRTESRRILESDAEDASRALAQIARPEVAGAAAEAFDMGRASVRAIIGDSEVSGHGAIVPTRMMDAQAFGRLEGRERRVALLVCCRLLSATMPPAARRRTKIVARAGGVELRASSCETLEASWEAVEDACAAMLGGESARGAGRGGAPIPEDVARGGALRLGGVEVKRGETSPPKPYTEDGLLEAMQHAGRLIGDADLRAAIDDDSSHSGGLGTPATRASIIEKIIGRGYAERKGRAIVSTPDGEALVDLVDEGLKSPELTARWERALSLVERGEMPLGDFMSRIECYTREVVAAAKESFDPARTVRRRAEEAGACPRCGSPVVRTGGVYQCSSNRSRREEDGSWTLTAGCGFKLFPTVAGKKLTGSQVEKLLSGETVRAKGLRSRKGSSFEAGLRLSPGGEVELVFGERRRKDGPAPSKQRIRSCQNDIK